MLRHVRISLSAVKSVEEEDRVDNSHPSTYLIYSNANDPQLPSRIAWTGQDKAAGRNEPFF
jgi:hypothetical protein